MKRIPAKPSALTRAMHQMEGRIVGLEALLNVVFREWGREPEVVMAYLEQTAERCAATSLQQPGWSDAHIEGMEHAFQEGIAALRGRIEFPDQ